tara:strand:- start:292 stop:930 length:639 start_codon:yes stop_codon:yes gene_type:complete
MRFDWKVYAKDRYVDSGTIQADTQKIAMGLVLAGQAEKDRDPDTSYRVTVGDSVTSSFGDEFLRSAEACSWTAEPEMDGGGTAKPNLADVGITLKDAMEYTKGIPATIEDIARIADVVLPKVLKDEGWCVSLPHTDKATVCEQKIGQRYLFGGYLPDTRIPAAGTPGEYIGATAEQVRIASDELDARIASYPSGRTVGYGQNFQQIPKDVVD